VGLAGFLGVLVVTRCTFAQGLVSMSTCIHDSYVRYSNTVTGVWVSGSDTLAGLYWAENAQTLASGGGHLIRGGGTNQTGLAVFLTGKAAGFIGSTSFGGNRTVESRVGQLTYFQVRAWSAGFDSYEAAAGSGRPDVLISRLTGEGAAPVAGAVPSPTIISPPPWIPWAPGSPTLDPVVVWMVSAGLTTDRIVPVPEPSTIAMVGLGLLGLLFIRRRK